MADKKDGCIVCARWFLHYLCGEQFCLKIVIEYQFAKIMCAYTALLSLFLTKYIVWMTVQIMAVQIMLTAESLLPACEWTAMHEKKGLNDSYVFSVHGILPSLLSLT